LTDELQPTKPAPAVAGPFARTATTPAKADPAIMRQFQTGATRHHDASRVDYEGFLSPLVLREFAKYMNKNRVQADGNVRASDNWQLGIPADSYMKSMWRHFMDVWSRHRDVPEEGVTPEMVEALCALFFNVQGYLHEEIRARDGRS
jgi:hypothetical protein